MMVVLGKCFAQYDRPSACARVRWVCEDESADTWLLGKRSHDDTYIRNVASCIYKPSSASVSFILTHSFLSGSHRCLLCVSPFSTRSSSQKKSPLPLGHNQTVLPILVHQHLLVLKRHKRRHPLELALPQRIQLSLLIPMEVLATHHPFLPHGIPFPQPRDIHEHSVVNINPSRINHILPLSPSQPVPERIHIQEVNPLLFPPALLVHVPILVETPVVPLRQHAQRRPADLRVQVKVPRQDPPVPPPPEQGAVRDPRLEAQRSEGGEIGADEVLKGRAVLRVRDHRAEEARVVVHQLVRPAGFVEVFVFWREGFVFIFLFFFIFWWGDGGEWTGYGYLVFLGGLCLLFFLLGWLGVGEEDGPSTAAGDGGGAEEGRED
ncbi:hypothetical protein VTI74DRAFT_2402 [Chaetomium olivicolor]